jgi:peptide/nickel transport system substrate-binding protein
MGRLRLLSVSIFGTVLVLWALSCAGPQALKEPRYGGTLTVLGPYGTTPYAWDPADCDWYQGYLCGPVYENLMMGNIYKGPRGTNEFQFDHPEWIPDEFLTGQLAESWEVKPNEKKIVFHIRKGVMWSGKPGVMEQPREFTAYDAEYALKRYINSPKISVGRFDWMDSLTATDKYTLELKYNTFTADWSYLLGWGWATDIEPRETVEKGASDPRNIVGTGPFILQEYVPGTSITFVRNPNYWQTAKIGGKEYKLPFVDKLVYLIIEDESTRIATLRTGKADLAWPISWKFKDSLQKSNPELQSWHRVSQTVFLVAMPCNKKPFDDRRVRLALSMAIDRRAVAKNPYYEPTDEPLILHYPMGATYPKSVYVPLEELPPSAREQFTYDPEKAKRLLAEAGYPQGFSTTMILHAYPDNQDLASLLAAMWEKIGVKVELKPMEYAAFQSMFLAKKHEGLVFYSKGLVHPLTVLRYNLPGQPWGPAEMWAIDPGFKDEYLACKSIENDEQRNKKIRELTVRHLDNVAYISLPGNRYYIYAWPWVKNYYGEINLGYINDASQAFAHIWIDEDLKRSMGR